MTERNSQELAALADVATDELREAFASLAHEQWSGWMEYLFSKSTKNEDGTVTLPAWAVERWERQVATPYADLSEKEQDSDRTEADKFIEVLKGMESLRLIRLDQFEQYVEYQQVAGLLAHDIEFYWDMLFRCGDTERLFQEIDEYDAEDRARGERNQGGIKDDPATWYLRLFRRVKEGRDKAINDAKARESRWQSIHSLFSLTSPQPKE